jgi:hypothetical protein
MTAPIEPPRISFVNLVTNEELRCEINPDSLDLRGRAVYGRAEVGGLSYRPLSYLGSDNPAAEIEVILSQQYRDRLRRRSGESPNIADHVAWLISLAYPAAEQDFAYSGPPDVLFVWPGTARLVVRVTEWEVIARDFDAHTLAMTYAVVRLGIEEKRTTRPLMADVVRNGLMRAAATSETRLVGG